MKNFNGVLFDTIMLIEIKALILDKLAKTYALEVRDIFFVVQAY